MPFFQNGQWPNFLSRPLLFVDLEMTGLNTAQHEIVEVAALLVDPASLEICNSYYTKVRPTHIESADPAALQVINYTAAEWTGAIPLEQMLAELSALAPYVYLAGWSVNTEYDFLVAALEQHHLPYFFDNFLIEVWTLAYTHFRGDTSLSRLNLPTVCAQFNISLQRHRPDSDIRATYEVFRRLLTEIAPK